MRTSLTLTLLCLISALGTSASAADNWEKCLSKVPAQELADAETEGGKLYVNEFLIERCGPRPVVSAHNGKQSLREQDCNQLFTWARNGDCDPNEWAEYQKAIAKQLNPRIFSERQYAATCAAMNSGQSARMNRSSFNREVCEK